MRKVEKKEELEGAFHAASREAQNAFGNGALYLEKFFDRARHIEVQILADHHNHLICLGERECSIQRRHQKLCEEAPANHLSPTQRKTLYNMALEGARAVGYQNAGTLEFVQDKEGNFYFMEMNTRLQVEHPVTEMITGVDIVQWQIRIASGEKLRLRQSDISFQGHAIEFRINAEDPYRHFMPTPGKLLDVVLPSGPGIRVDTFLYPHLKIPQKYDSLIAKLIVWAENRSLCLARAASALESFHIRGIPTTIPFHQALLQEKWFQKGEVHIHSLLEHQPALGSALREEEAVAIAFALYHGTASSLHHRPYVSLGWKRAARQEALRV